MDVIASNVDMNAAHSALVPLDDAEMQLDALLSSLEQSRGYDTIIVDCPPQLG